MNKRKFIHLENRGWAVLQLREHVAEHLHGVGDSAASGAFGGLIARNPDAQGLTLQ
jgi:hypothetical protein